MASKSQKYKDVVIYAFLLMILKYLFKSEHILQYAIQTRWSLCTKNMEPPFLKNYKPFWSAKLL